MRSTDRRRAQSGQSLIEAMVASALVGIALLAGLTTLDAAVSGARRAVHGAWADCMLRGEAQLISSQPWSDVSYPAPANVTAAIVWTSGSYPNALQKVSLGAVDPDPPHPVLVSTTLYKSALLSPDAGANTYGGLGSAPADAIASGCRPLLGSS
jgi:Tfp pilus assembly protein PilV